MRVYQYLTYSVTALILIHVSLGTTTGGAFPSTPRTQPRSWVIDAPPIRFIADHPLPQASKLHKDLVHLSSRLQKDLGVPPLKHSVRVYVYKSLKDYQRAVLKTIPYLREADVQRSGIFLWRNNTPYVFLVHDKTFPRTLRHEFTHVMLNVHFGEIPIWVDEGLALYYENGAAVGWNSEMAEELTTQLTRGWIPDLKTLEKRRTMQDLDYLSYAESWGWTYLLLTRTPNGNVHMQNYLNRVKRSRKKINLTDSLGRVRGDLTAEWGRVFHPKHSVTRTHVSLPTPTTVEVPQRKVLLPRLFSNTTFGRNRRGLFSWK
ncbi:MAG: hypothetical protein ACFCD0_16480 [Gemmataceae bacterium]